jgi:hypothetical protein
MTTHEVAKILTVLAQALRHAPNQPFDEFLGTIGRQRAADPSSIPVALTTLVALSDFDKQQWINLIRECDFPIQVRPRDASRDIIGNVLRHLENNADSRKRLSAAAQGTRSKTSPELVRALQFLLRP